jgi:hypothetical protein
LLRACRPPCIAIECRRIVPGIDQAIGYDDRGVVLSSLPLSLRARKAARTCAWKRFIPIDRAFGGVQPSWRRVAVATAATDTAATARRPSAKTRSQSRAKAATTSHPGAETRNQS